jgi:natural product biosynthesis luciferase-like monooxygenase protein
MPTSRSYQLFSANPGITLMRRPGTWRGAFGLKFGTFHIFNRREGQTDKQVYAEQLEQMEWADRLGYASVWLTEHHFTDYGILPDPMLLAADIARRTKTVRIGMAVSVLAFHNPIRLAEQAAMVDLLSDGRLDLGVGRGYQPQEFAKFGIPMEEARGRFDESLELVRRLWSEDNVTFEGKYFRAHNVTLEPKPVQQPLPVMVATSGTPETLNDIARRRLTMLQGFAAADGLNKLGERLTLYAEARRKLGHPEAEIEAAVHDTGVLRRVYVADNLQKSYEEPKDAILWYYGLLDHLNLPADLKTNIPAEYAYQKKAAEERAKHSYQDFWDHGVFGDVATCIEKVEQVRGAGINYMLNWTSLGGLAQDKVLHSMELFATKVMPRFLDPAPAPVVAGAR